MKYLFVGVAVAIGCRDTSRARSLEPTPVVPDASRPLAPAAAPLAYPHRPPGCGYLMRPPHAGRLQVVAHADTHGPQPRVRNLHLTFVGDPSTSLVVQWNTDLSTLDSTVNVREADGRALPSFAGYSFPLLGAHDRRQHEVHLCGLRPSTRYEYLAGGARGESRWHSFTTAPDGPGEVRAGVAGDSRNDLLTWGRVSRALLAMHPDVLLFTGDAVADGGSAALWDAFFAAGADLLAEIPGVWADGNHEGRSTVYYDQFALPAAGNAEWDEHWFALDYGPLRVITLNDTTESDADVVGEETDFLRTTLGSIDRARTPWVVTMHHQPIYTDAVGHRPDLVTRGAWAPLFDQYHVDVDLSGHVHNYESTEPIRAGSVVDAAQGTRYIIFGGAGAPLYPFRQRQPWVHQRESTHGFGILTASATVLRWEAFRDDGSVIEALDLARRGPR